MTETKSKRPSREEKPLYHHMKGLLALISSRNLSLVWIAPHSFSSRPYLMMAPYGGTLWCLHAGTYPGAAVWWTPRLAYRQALVHCTQVCSSWHLLELAWNWCSLCREPWPETQAPCQWETGQKPPSPLQQRLRNGVALPSLATEPAPSHTLAGRLSWCLRWESAGAVSGLLVSFHLVNRRICESSSVAMMQIKAPRIAPCSYAKHSSVIFAKRLSWYILQTRGKVFCPSATLTGSMTHRRATVLNRQGLSSFPAQIQQS